MCGIAGYIVKKELYSSGIHSTLLRDMADSISHRGPDDAGFFETVSKQGDFCIGLAHKRLSIIDLNTGHQPIGNEDNSIQIVFNGEIYNYPTLRENLIGAGHQFKTASDTETIVHAYEQYGDNVVKVLKGMFAFALWDNNKSRLILARDHFGKKPLFVYETEQIFLFSSEIKALLNYKELSKDVDKQAIWQYLQYRYVPGPNTLISAIKKLNPGSVLNWRQGKTTQSRFYYPPDKNKLTVNNNSSFDPVNQFREKLDHAVKVRMMSDVPFGAFLSGGIDSSAIVCYMSKHSSLPIKTFSVGFSERRYSELPYAKTVADYFKTDHHELYITSQDIIDELPKMIRYRDGPVSEPSDIPIYLLSKEASKHVKMVLTGEGSDEILGGYPKHVFEHYVKYYQYIPKPVRNLIGNVIFSLPYRFRRAKTAIANLGLENAEERLPGWFGALSNSERTTLVAFTMPVNDIQREPFDVDEDNSSLRKILYFDQTSWLPDNLLERGDRMTMAASIEGRMPFMDIDLVAFVSQLPDKYRVNKSVTKWILREAIREHIPIEIINRPKVGFRVPVNEWFQGELREFLVDNLTSRNSITRSYYKSGVLNGLLDAHIKGKRNHEKLLWTLLNLELWHKQCLQDV